MNAFEYIIFIAGLIFISMCIGAIVAASGCKFGKYLYKNGEKE